MGKRTAWITRASRNAMQSSGAATAYWLIRFSPTKKWSHPLMGWLSSADPLVSVPMLNRFERLEQAILWCERHGYKFEVQEEAVHFQRRGLAPGTYSDCFLTREVQAQMKALGPRKARFIFENPDGKQAAWINLRRTQFGPEPWKPANYQTAAAWTGDGWPAPVEKKFYGAE